jgi:AbiV family abortive infection protein
MDARAFDGLSELELIHGCKSCVTNAKSHYESALKIAEIGHYGIASSLLILSVEETIKGLVFMHKLMGMGTPDKVERFFSQHESRHHMARDLYDLIKNILSSVEEVRAYIKESGRLLMVQYVIKGIPDDIEAWKIEYLTELNKSTQDGINKIILSKSNIRNEQQERVDKKWWNKANYLKNSGFYVDYKGKWLLPQNITKEGFEETKTKVYDILELLLKICDIDTEGFEMLKRLSSGKLIITN